MLYNFLLAKVITSIVAHITVKYLLFFFLVSHSIPKLVTPSVEYFHSLIMVLIQLPLIFIHLMLFKIDF